MWAFKINNISQTAQEVLQVQTSSMVPSTSSVQVTSVLANIQTTMSPTSQQVTSSFTSQQAITSVTNQPPITEVSQQIGIAETLESATYYSFSTSTEETLDYEPSSIRLTFSSEIATASSKSSSVTPGPSARSDIATILRRYVNRHVALVALALCTAILLLFSILFGIVASRLLK